MALNVFSSASILEQFVNCWKQLAENALCKASLSVISTFKSSLSTLYFNDLDKVQHAIKHSILQKVTSRHVVKQRFKQFQVLTVPRGQVQTSSPFPDNPVELFVCETDNGPAWKTYELSFSHIHMLICRKSGFTHTSMAKTNNIMAGVPECFLSSQSPLFS